MSAVDLGPCVAPTCGRNATTRTPTFRLPVCAGHDGDDSSDSEVRRYCGCGEPALLPGKFADMCSNHIANGHGQLSLMVRQLRTLNQEVSV